MQVQEIRTIARSLGVNPGKRDKASLVRAIQLSEGNFDCFGTAYDGICDQSGCLWREDCFAVAVRDKKHGH